MIILLSQTSKRSDSFPSTKLSANCLYHLRYSIRINMELCRNTIVVRPMWRTTWGNSSSTDKAAMLTWMKKELCSLKPILLTWLISEMTLIWIPDENQNHWEHGRTITHSLSENQTGHTKWFSWDMASRFGIKPEGSAAGSTYLSTI